MTLDCLPWGLLCKVEIVAFNVYSLEWIKSQQTATVVYAYLFDQ